jgi:hypothetical protein
MKGTLLFITIFIFYSFSPNITENSLNRSKWIQAGKSFVNVKLDNVSIYPSRQDSEFTAMRLVFEGESIDAHHFMIHFEDGKSKRYLLKRKCGNGFKSRIVDFEGGVRAVKKVDLWYRPNPLENGESIVILWGKE